MGEYGNIEDISDEEKQKIYTHFCQLITILHDYALGKKLYSENSSSWAITANYYSLMHCGRFICNLGIEDHPTSHANLHKLLSGNSVAEGSRKRNTDKSFEYQNLLNSINSYIPNSDSKIEILGEKLELIKQIREYNSYELFIIAHQHNHVFLKNIFNNCYFKVESANLDYIEFCLDLLVEYINTSPSKEFYIAFLTKESESYGNPVQYFIHESTFYNKIDKQIMDDIKQLIDNKFMNFHAIITLKDSFFTPINYRNFNSKLNVMNKFKQKVAQL